MTPAKAWATLLTRPTYVPGVRVLRASLARAESPYPLVVLVTDTVGEADRQLLRDEGCLVHEVHPLRPPEHTGEHYANARFAEVWTKLAVWALTDFERVVYLDADMLVTRNMDELFDLELAPGSVAACHACRCNPERIASYPASWTPEHCAYTHLAEDPSAVVDDPYLNAGLLVLSPSQEVFADLLARLAGVADLRRFPFAEQDFLNEYFDGNWRALPYVYNALKTLPFQHPTLWDAADVKNIHFIIDKPWQRELDPADPYVALNRLWWETAADVPQLSVSAAH